MMTYSYEGIRLPWPVDWSALFGRSAPLIMEIGFGGGYFLLDLAQKHPDANIVGVEISHHCLWDVEKQLPRLNLPNLRLIHSTAQMVLAYVCAPAVIDKLYINFPDPFPKNAHVGRRLLNPETLHLIASRLKTGGQLTIATDVAAYAESIAHDLASTPGLVNQHATPWVTAVPGRTVTRYERKAQQRGVTCHYFEWTRDDQPVPVPAVPPPPGETMPNVVLESKLTFDQIADAFQPVEFKHDAIHVRLLSIYQNRYDNGLLIDSFIDEPLIEQRPGIAIVRHDEPSAGAHRYVVRLALIGYPRPTRGAHLAVKNVAEWLAALDPETRVLHQNIGVE